MDINPMIEQYGPYLESWPMHALVALMEGAEAIIEDTMEQAEQQALERRQAMLAAGYTEEDLDAPG